MAQTTYGDISPAVAASAAVEMLKRGQPNLVIQQFLQSKPLGKNQTDTMKFRRYERLSAATTALTEGVTPTGSTPTKTDYSATLGQYGDFLELTDKIADMHTDPVLKEYSGMLGEQAALTLDTLAFNILKAGTNLIRANGAARTDINTPLTLNLQRKAVRALKRQYGEKITSKISSSAKFNTESVKPAYIGLVHPDMTFVIRDMVGFKDVVDYGGGMDMYMGEIGSVEEVRYIESTVFAPWADGGGAKAGSGTTMISTAGTLADVYPVLYLARDCAGAVALKGANAITPGVLNPGVMREGDPLGQRGYVSWKTYYTAVILNQSFMVRVECAIPELS
jgi:N4-gp56 family major capsid protein